MILFREPENQRACPKPPEVFEFVANHGSTSGVTREISRICQSMLDTMSYEGVHLSRVSIVNRH